MNRATVFAGILLLAATGVASAQEEKQPEAGVSAQGQAGASADVEAGQSSASLAQGTEVSATLTKPLDADKAEPGDEVNARAAKDVRSNGQVVVPRGSRLIGRVTRAEPRKSGGNSGGGSPSTLGIVFDRAVLSDGSEIILNGSVAAIGAARAAGTTAGGRADGGAAGAAGAAGSGAGSAGGLTGAVGGTVGGVAGAATGVGSTVGAATQTAARSTGAIGGFDAGGGLQSGSRGVFGLRNLDIAADATGGAEGSVVTSAGRTVRLESGTQMLLVAGGSAGKGAEAAGEPAAGQPPPREPVDHR